MKPLLTIAVPTYNGENRIHMSLNSIFSQYDPRVEVLVSDNCSTDGTEDYLKENYPQIVYYRNEKNVGMENFQRCYKRATGKFMLLLGDDDILTEGSLKRILDFLEENLDLKLLFLNHTSFTRDYEGIDSCESGFFEPRIGDLVTDDKNTFVKIAKYQLTYIGCCILSKDAYDCIDHPDQYNSNWFLQTIIAFKATEDNDSKFGIISRICVAQNKEQNNAADDMDAHMEIFGIGESDLFCNIAPTCGYDQKMMRKIYCDFVCSSWPKVLLGYKARGFVWKDAFWNKGFPIIRHFPKAWFTIIPAAFVPDCIAKIARNIKLKIKKQHKE